VKAIVKSTISEKKLIAKRILFCKHIIDKCKRITLKTLLSRDSKIAADICEILLRGAGEDSIIKWTKINKQTPLMVAIKNFAFEVIEVFLNKNLFINVIPSPFITAIHLRNIDMVKLFLKYKEKYDFLNVTDWRNEKPIALTIRTGSKPVFIELLKNLEDYQIVDTMRNQIEEALFLMLTLGKSEIIYHLMDRLVKFTTFKNTLFFQIQRESKTALNYACTYSTLKCLKALEYYMGDDIFTKEHVLIAISNSKFEIAKYLIEKEIIPPCENKEEKSIWIILLTPPPFERDVEALDRLSFFTYLLQKCYVKLNNLDEESEVYQDWLKVLNAIKSGFQDEVTSPATFPLKLLLDLEKKLILSHRVTYSDYTESLQLIPFIPPFFLELVNTNKYSLKVMDAILKEIPSQSQPSHHDSDSDSAPINDTYNHHNVYDQNQSETSDIVNYDGIERRSMNHGLYSSNNK